MSDQTGVSGYTGVSGQISKVRTVLKSSDPTDFKTDLTLWIWPSRSWDIAKKTNLELFCGHGVY